MLQAPDARANSNTPTKGRAPWRFSIRDLIVLIGAFAIVVWLFSWSWDWDEQIVLGAWLGCLVTVWVFVSRGVIAWGVSVALAGIVPAIAFWAFHVIRGIFWRYYFGPVMDHMFLALLSIALAGCFGALVITSGAVGWRVLVRPSRWRPAVLTTAVVATAVGIGFTAYFYAHARSLQWRPFLTINELAVVPSHSTFPYALSADGALLAVAQPPVDDTAPHTIRIWDLAKETYQPVHVWNVQQAYSLCFSPDHKQMAIMHVPDGGLTVHDTSTGATISTLTLQAVGDGQCHYTPDGSSLVASRLDRNRDTQVHIWKTRRMGACRRAIPGGTVTPRANR
jgi:hypothetical protein